MVKEAADKTLLFDIIYLPDYSKEYIVKKRGFIGATNVAMKLENGWNLTEFGSTSDSKVPETLTALTSLLPALIGAGEDSPLAPAISVIKPGLYKLTFNTVGELDGITPVKLFQNP